MRDPAPARVSIRHVLTLCAIAIVAGVLSGAVVRLVLLVTALAVDAGRPSFAGALAIAIVAALINGQLIYRFAPEAAGEGIPAYNRAILTRHARFSWRATLMKIPAALVTLLGGGSGGLIGPVGRGTAGLLALPFGRPTEGHRRNEYRRTAAVCGMAATVAAVTGAALGGAIFAVEIVQREDMRYRDLFPSLIAAAVAAAGSAALGWNPVIEASGQVAEWTTAGGAALLATVVLVTLVASLFSSGYGIAARLFRRSEQRHGRTTVVGMVLAVSLVSLVNPRLLSTAPLLFSLAGAPPPAELYGNLPAAAPLVLVVLILIALRIVASFATVGSGMSGGLTGPAMQVGMLCGVLGWQLFAPHLSAVDALPFLAVGFAGVLAGAMNVPIAAAVAAVEIFGAGIAVPAAVAAVVSFQVNRHRTVYDYAIAGAGADSVRVQPNDTKYP